MYSHRLFRKSVPMRMEAVSVMVADTQNVKLAINSMSQTVCRISPISVISPIPSPFSMDLIFGDLYRLLDNFKSPM